MEGMEIIFVEVLVLTCQREDRGYCGGYGDYFFDEGVG